MSLTSSLTKELARRSLGAINNGLARIPAWYRFCRYWRDYNRLAARMGARPAEPEFLTPCIGDDRGVVPIEPVYFYQDAWAFERICKRQPDLHVDVGSHHKFISLLSKVVPVEEVDLRPWALPMDSVRFRLGSILALPYPDASITSLSSICVIEHIGLGRYGDPLDPEGSHKAINELKRVLAPGGDLYVSLPIDRESRVYFNAHRAFTESDVETLAAPFKIIDRAYIFGDRYTPVAEPRFGIGCYHLQRPKMDQR